MILIMPATRAAPPEKSSEAKEKIMYAAIGTDGIRDVVWGIGDTADAAIGEAREGLRQDGTPDTVELRTQEISAGDVAAVEGGEVDAARLGRR